MNRLYIQLMAHHPLPNPAVTELKWNQWNKQLLYIPVILGIQQTLIRKLLIIDKFCPQFEWAEMFKLESNVRTYGRMLICGIWTEGFK